MDDYISRQKLAMHLVDVQYGEAPAGRVLENIEYKRGVYDGLGMAIAAVEGIPAADVRPVVKAIPITVYEFLMDDDGTQLHKTQVGCMCPICGSTGVINYCPNCGADMREADDESPICTKASPASLGIYTKEADHEP